LDYPEFEIGLHRRDAASYAVEVRFRDPNQEAEQRAEAYPVRFDFEQLRGLAADPAAYGQLLGQNLIGQPEVRSCLDKARTVAQMSERRLRLRLCIDRDWFTKQLIGAQHVRRPVLVNEALEFGLTPKCLEVLDKAFLIRRENRSGAQWYELAHDRLMTPVLTDNETWRAEHLSTFQLQGELWAERGHPVDLLRRSVRSRGSWRRSVSDSCLWCRVRKYHLRFQSWHRC